MPPVFGPVSPSPARLKSCAAPSGTACAPSDSANSDTSSPSSSSSITNSPPNAATARNAASTSSALRQTNTPLPAARPSALTTQGARATDSVSAVGTPAACSTSFAKVFDPSICAAAALGPKTAIPFRRSTSAIPATSGPSGPITTRSALSVNARLRRPSASSARTGWQRPIAAIPGLPGAAWSSVRPGLCSRRHASACSRAPEPTTTTCTRRGYLRRDRTAVFDREGGGRPLSRWRHRGCRRRRRAARDSHRRCARGRHDAHPGPRRGAGDRLRALGRAAAGTCPTAGRSGGEHSRARRPGVRSGPARAQLLYDVVLRRLRQGRPRGGRRGGAARRERLSPAGDARRESARPRCARRSRRSRRPAACTPRVSSTSMALCSACARTSGGTTRWTR